MKIEVSKPLRHNVTVRHAGHLLLILLGICAIPAGAESFNWTHYGADAASTKFAPVDQIDSTNVDQLRALWRWQSSDFDIREREDVPFNAVKNPATPLFVDGVLYTSTPLNQVVALDAADGLELWAFDTEAWRQPSYWPLSRGVAYWSDGERRRILYGNSAARLFSLDAATGEPDPGFGDGGSVDLTQGLHRPVPEPELYSVCSPPLIVGDVVIVGSSIEDWARLPPAEFTALGDVRGYDVRTGELLWTFHAIPRPGEFGHETWETERWDRYGAANVWTIMSADEELGYVYLPFTSPSNDFYGGGRPGDNLFGQSLVCLEAKTGRRVWHYQIVHHEIWDYDLPAAPILLDIEVDGRKIKAVAQVTKQAFVFVFDRVTGEPVWPIEERPVPESTVPGERTSPTQPVPTRPAPVDRQGLSAEDLIDFTPELKQAALEIIQEYDYGPIYTPPSERGAIAMPGGLGGGDWVGAAAHPGKGWLYVPSKTLPMIYRVREVAGEGFDDYYGHRPRRIRGPQQLPLTRPPYGRITAINLNTGVHEWVAPMGKGPVDHPALKEMELPDLGWDGRNFVLATPTLLFATPQHPTADSKGSYDFYVDPDANLKALDLQTGRLLARVPLPDNANGNPMTYVADDRQFVVVPQGNWDEPAGLVGLAIPIPGETYLAMGLEREDATHPAFYQGVAAIDDGNVEGLKSLLQEHQGLKEATGFQDELYKHGDLRGATLLHLIAGEPQRAELPANVTELAAVLLEAGLDPNAVTLEGLTPLSFVGTSRQVRWLEEGGALMRMLLEADADPSGDGGRLVWRSVVRDNKEDLDLLLQHGAELDLKLSAALNMVDRLPGFFTPDDNLIDAAGAGYRPPLADRTEPWSNQDLLNEALSYASFAGHQQVAEILLDKGAQINAIAPPLWQWDRGSTALHKAAIEGKTEMVEFLLSRGADPTTKDARADLTPGAWAEFRSHEKIVGILQAAAAAWNGD